MNELKRELMKVAGDMSDSELRVREAVSRRVSKKKRRWLPVTVAVVAIVTLFIFIIFIQFQPQDTSAMLSQEEYAYYLHVESAMWERDLGDAEKTHAFERLLQRVGRVEYGKSLGLSVSATEIDARIEDNKRLMESAEYESMIAKVLNEANVSKRTYEEITRKQSESYLMGELISQRLQKQYEQLGNMMASHMTDYYAALYMEQHYAEEVKAFRTQYKIAPESHHTSAVMGVIGLVEGNMFYLIQDATFPDVKGMEREEMIATYFENELGSWYPNVDGLQLSVGDVVRVPSNASVSEGGHRVGMNYGGVKILQRATEPATTVHFTGEQADKFTAHIETLDWETNIHVSMTRLPDYTVTANGATYSIWSKYNNSGMEVIQHEPNAYVKLTKSKAAPLFELLQ
ncbi:MAG: hypothetical protein ABS951_14040 [Solibacillus sp.]